MEMHLSVRYVEHDTRPGMSAALIGWRISSGPGVLAIEAVRDRKVRSGGSS